MGSHAGLGVKSPFMYGQTPQTDARNPLALNGDDTPGVAGYGATPYSRRTGLFSPVGALHDDGVGDSLCVWAAIARKAAFVCWRPMCMVTCVFIGGGLHRFDGNGSKSCWVTAFGFRPGMSDAVLRHFQSYGTIVNQRVSNSNWLHIQYGTRLCAVARMSLTCWYACIRYEDADQANKALGANGRKHNGFMLGVVPCSEAVRVVASWAVWECRLLSVRCVVLVVVEMNLVLCVTTRTSCPMRQVVPVPLERGTIDWRSARQPCAW